MKPESQAAIADVGDNASHKLKRYSDFPTADPKFARIIYGVMCGFAGAMTCSGVIGIGIKGTFSLVSMGA